MTRLANLIDGGYQSRVTQELGFPFIRFAALTKKMACGIEIYKSYYYDCLPFLSKSATPGERCHFDHKDRFFSGLARLPRFVVRLGQLRFRGFHANGRPNFQQKRVDTSVAVDLTILSERGLITHASIFAGDSDFIPPVEAAQAAGVHVHLFYGRGVDNELLRLCDSATEITADFAKAIASPDH